MSISYEQLASEFAAPQAPFRPMIFWVWNGDMTREGIAEDIRDFADKRLGGFFIHPMGEGFRLRDFIKGINPPYLSDEYFELVRYAVECARDAGLYAWLYDEGGWPSGTAQGHVLDGHPEHEAKTLEMQCADVTSTGAYPALPEDCVAILAITDEGLPTVVEPTGSLWTPPPGTNRLLFFTEQPVAERVDLLNPAAVARFIEVTHERYAAVVGEFFGTVIPGMFTDEPSIPGRLGSGAIQYTPGILQAFQDRRGFDIRPYLPALFAADLCDEDLLARYDETDIAAIHCEYSALWTDLYREAYWQQINDWCASHGLLHTGHVGGEDNLPDHINGGFGHWFKTAGTLHVPGIDAIWRQIFPGGENADYPQLASSAVNQRETLASENPFARAVITETGGVYSFGHTYEQMRWVADFQFQRGVSLYAPMDYGYACDEGRGYRTLSDLGPGNPLWPHYGEFSDYIGRLSSVLRRADMCCSVAVYYPVEDLWAEAGSPDALAATWETMRTVTDALSKHQVTFEYIDAETLCAATVADGALITPGHDYLTVIVPGAKCLPLAVMQKLKALHRAGGRVAFASATPQICADFGKQAQFDVLRGELSRNATVMDYEEEMNRIGGEDLSAFAAPVRMWDGFSSAMGVPPMPNRFAADVLDPSALLVVPPAEIGRLARLISVTGAQYRLQVNEPHPDLCLNAFAIGEDTLVHFLTNESSEEIPVELAVVSEVPLQFELWDCETGDIHAILEHEDITEETPFSGELSPSESVLLVSCPLPVAPAEADETPAAAAKPAPEVEEKEPRFEEFSLALYESCDDLEVRQCCRIEGGDLRLCDPASVPLPQGEVELRPWEEWGLGDFSGSIAYRFALPLAEEYQDESLLLRLGDCLYVAEVWLNGELEAKFLWGPYELDVTDALNVGHNELVIVVTNTLANQALRLDVIAEAKAKGWFNSYYERCLPMMEESLQSGLIGPVELVVMLEK